MQQDFRQSFVSNTFTKHCTTIQRNFLLFIPKNMKMSDSLTSNLSFNYPLHSVKIMSGFVQMYSTVGVLVPI